VGGISAASRTDSVVVAVVRLSPVLPMSLVPLRNFQFMAQKDSFLTGTYCMFRQAAPPSTVCWSQQLPGA